MFEEKEKTIDTLKWLILHPHLKKKSQGDIIITIRIGGSISYAAI